MPAYEHLNPDEFAHTFMPTHWGADWDEASSALSREDPSHQASLTNSVRERGIQEPVRVTPRLRHSSQRYVVDGHHRVAAARATGQPIPYQNFGDESDAPELRNTLR